MPKKKNKKKSGLSGFKTGRSLQTSDGSDEDDWNGSQASEDTLVGASIVREDSVDVDGLEEQAGDKMNELIELLTEKRYTTRENALSDLIKILCLGCRTEECEAVRETVSMYLCTSIKRGKKKESSLGSRCLSIIGITLGMDNDTFVEECVPVLESMAQKCKDESSRSEAIMAMATLCFICSTIEDRSASAIRILTTILNKASQDLASGKKSKRVAPPKVITATCRAWSLLASVAPHEFFAGRVFDECVGYFHVLLGYFCFV